MASKQGNTTTTNDGIEVYENEILYFLEEYENKWNIDLHEIDMNRWNSCLIYIGNNCYKHTDKLKSKPYDIKRNGDYTNNNKYDLDKVIDILDIYIQLCYEYSKEVTILGFSYISAIDRMTLYNWFSKSKDSIDSYDSSDDTSKAMYIYKTLQESKQDTLSNKLYSSNNPVGTIAILNHDFNWNNSNSLQLTSGPSQTITEIQEKYITENSETGKETSEN